MQRGLRCAVGCDRRHRGKARGRPDGDDGTAVARQRRRQLLEQAQRAEVVHFHLAARLIDDTVAGDPDGQLHAGVAEQQFDVRGRLCHGRHVIGVGDIELQRHDALVVQIPQHVEIASRRVHLPGAPREQRLGEGSSEAAIGARHQGDSAFDSLCSHRLSPVIANRRRGGLPDTARGPRSLRAAPVR
jgi:hypothetical protein